MRQGSTVAIVRDFDTPPIESRNTRLIAAAIASGCEFGADQAFSDTIEDVGGNPKRTVTWMMDGAKKVKFAPIAKEEELTFTELQKRFDSQEWCEENSDHPIAYMRAMSDCYNRLVDKIKTMRPMLLIRRGNRLAIVPSGNDPESKAKREKILSYF
jgi:hypothetical protein